MWHTQIEPLWYYGFAVQSRLSIQMINSVGSSLFLIVSAIKGQLPLLYCIQSGLLSLVTVSIYTMMIQINSH